MNEINAWSFRFKHPFVPTDTMHSTALFIADSTSDRKYRSVQWQSSDSAHELREENHAEPDIVVTVVGVIAVAVRATTPPGIVVPGTATNHAVRTLDRYPSFSSFLI